MWSLRSCHEPVGGRPVRFQRNDKIGLTWLLKLIQSLGVDKRAATTSLAERIGWHRAGKPDDGSQSIRHGTNGPGLTSTSQSIGTMGINRSTRGGQTRTTYNLQRLRENTPYPVDNMEENLGSIEKLERLKSWSKFDFLIEFIVV